MNPALHRRHVAERPDWVTPARSGENTDRGLSPSAVRVDRAGQAPRDMEGMMPAFNGIAWFEIGTDNPGQAERFLR